MLKKNYKEVQAERKSRKVGSYDLATCQNKKIVVAGEMYICFKEGMRKVGVNVDGKKYFTPPEPKNKKERRKMKAGLPYIDKKGTIRTAEK